MLTLASTERCKKTLAGREGPHEELSQRSGDDETSAEEFLAAAGVEAMEAGYLSR